MKKFILLLFVQTVLLTNLKAQVLEVVDAKPFYSLKGKCFYYLDQENLSLDQVLKKKFDPSYPPQWYNEDTYYWISFEVNNQSSTEDFILTIDQWEEVEFYHQVNGAWKKTISGTRLPINERPESLHRLLTFPIRQTENSQTTYLLKVKNTSTTMRYYQSVYDFLSKLEWQFAAEARSKFILNQVIIFFVLGLCFALLIFNGVRIFLKPNDELFFLFSYIIVTAVFIANIHGVATNYLFPWIQSFQMPLGVILVHISSILIAFYVRSFLKTKGKEVENMLLMIMVGFMSISLLYTLIDSQPHWYYFRRYVEGGILGITLLSAIIKRKKDVSYLLAAFFFALTGRYISEYLSGFNLFVWGDLPYLIGFMLQLTLFTIASSVKMNNLEKDFNKTLLEKQQLLVDQNQKLNELVEKRTTEIRQANDEISSRNEELKSTIEVLKGTQKRLIETENMAVIGRISSGLAHELNNPLNVIGGLVRPIRNNLNELKNELPNIPSSSNELLNEISYLLEDIETAAEKAAGVVKNLGNITPKRMFQKKLKLDLEELLLDVMMPFQEKYPSIHFQIHKMESLYIHGWPEELGKLFENILCNAVDAIGHDSIGRIDLTVSKENESVIIQFKDSGSGIDPELIRYIFEPFYTTKTPGMGTGLGLFISKTIAYKHGGNVRVSSELGIGSTFAVVLPIN